ncbi:unnamed protein product [Acanthoscelides obtectus]|uniref:Uncharacterized protein n=1 Tax=Acanthoscelides obtectus TaxID=200917 RepID=A0A9P0MBT9_ACAOB|nr:unnamed protein product [Acanthoscelides obtectus]CAK1629951.1 hypothetical protein AOBTE_LOCUS6060 [Acanthoscelides obtectus]
MGSDRKVISVKFNQDQNNCALLNQIHVFSFPTPTQRLFTLETRENHEDYVMLVLLLLQKNKFWFSLATSLAVFS